MPTKNADYYDRIKLSKNFIQRGKCGAIRAKLASIGVYLIRQVHDPFRPLVENDLVVVRKFQDIFGWQAENPYSHEKLTRPMLFVQNPVQPIIDTIQPLVDQLASEHSKVLSKRTGWRGIWKQIEPCTSELQTAVSKIDTALPKSDAVVVKSLRPLVTTVPQHTARMGTTAYGCAGAGHFVVPQTHPIAVTVLSGETLVNKVGLESVDGIDKALDERTMANLWLPRAVVLPGSAMWIPTGSLALVCHDQELGSFVTVPWVCSEEVKMLDAEVGGVIIREVYRSYSKQMAQGDNRFADVAAGFRKILEILEG